MKKVAKSFLVICFIVIPVFFEFYILFEGIHSKIEYKDKLNGFIALMQIILSGSLLLSSCGYFFVKLKYFPLFNMLFALIFLIIGEFIVCFRYDFRFENWNVMRMLVILLFWIFIKSLIFKKIYKWL